MPGHHPRRIQFALSLRCWHLPCRVLSYGGNWAIGPNEMSTCYPKFSSERQTVIQTHLMPQTKLQRSEPDGQKVLHTHATGGAHRNPLVTEEQTPQDSGVLGRTFHNAFSRLSTSTLEYEPNHSHPGPAKKRSRNPSKSKMPRTEQGGCRIKHFRYVFAYVCVYSHFLTTDRIIITTVHSLIRGKGRLGASGGSWVGEAAATESKIQHVRISFAADRQQKPPRLRSLLHQTKQILSVHDRSRSRQ